MQLLAPRAPEILYEDSDVAVLNKPAGIAVHPSPTRPDEPSIVPWLLKRFPGLRDVGEDPLRPGIVHRLDKETSGVMVVAKTQRAFEHIKKQFQERSVKKTYLALVAGKMPSEKGIIDLEIARSKKFGKFTTKRLIQREGTRRNAVTAWKVRGCYKGDEGLFFTLLEVTPETGRTHQIRVHLAAKGHPVVGDPLYGGDYVRRFRGTLGRMFLHAMALELTLPSGSHLKAEAPLPKELNLFLKGLAPVSLETINALC